jgi:hypothetical protein
VLGDAAGLPGVPGVGDEVLELLLLELELEELVLELIDVELFELLDLDFALLLAANATDLAFAFFATSAFFALLIILVLL